MTPENQAVQQCVHSTSRSYARTGAIVHFVFELSSNTSTGTAYATSHFSRLWLRQRQRGLYSLFLGEGLQTSPGLATTPQQSQTKSRYHVALIRDRQWLIRGDAHKQRLNIRHSRFRDSRVKVPAAAVRRGCRGRAAAALTTRGAPRPTSGCPEATGAGSN